MPLNSHVIDVLKQSTNETRVIVVILEAKSEKSHALYGQGSPKMIVSLLQVPERSQEQKE